MKKLILTCALMMSACMLSFAQNTQTTTTTATTTEVKQTNATAPQAAAPVQRQRANTEQMAQRRSQYFQKTYGLDDNQTKSVYQAQLDYFNQMMVYRDAGKQPTAPQAQQMNMLMDQKFKAVMTADQYTKYAATRPQSAPQSTTSPAPAKN